MGSIKEVFVSYGHQDAGMFTDKLCESLGTKGVKVWRDINEIRYGDAWREMIVKGITGSDVFIAVLSQHAQRDPHSPCNNEIAKANGIGGLRIVPVRVNAVDIPFDLGTRHYLDLNGWDLEKQMSVGLERVMRAILFDEFPVDDQHRLLGLLRPSDFSPRISSLVRSFVGREDLLRKIEERLNSSACRMLVLEGDPGIGKSCVWGNLVRSAKVHAWYACSSNTTADDVIRTVAYQLAISRDWYRKAIRTGALAENHKDLLNQLIIEPMRGFPQHAPLIIAIDGLDEARGSGKWNELLDVLNGLREAPEHVKVLITARADGTRMSLGLHEHLTIRADDPMNRSDLRHYLAIRANEPRFRVHTNDPNAAITSIAERANGNFLFASTLCDSIEAGHMAPDAADLPQDLGAYYASRFSRLFPDEASFGPVAAVLDLLCAAKSPLNKSTIAEMLGKDPDEVHRAMNKLPPLVRTENGHYVPFHKTLFEWLETEKPGSIHHTYPRKGHRAIIAWCKANLNGPDDASSYDLALLPAHFMDLGDRQGLQAFLEDPRCLDHIELRDPTSLKAIWSYANGGRSFTDNAEFASMILGLLEKEEPDPDKPERIGRTLKVAALCARMELWIENWKLLGPVLEHADRGPLPEGIDHGKIMLDAAIALRNLGQLDRSKTLFERAGAMIAEKHGEASSMSALHKYRFATLLWQISKGAPEGAATMARADELYREAAGMLEGSTDPLLLPELLNDHSVLLNDLGMHTEAVRSCERGTKLLKDRNITTGVVLAELTFTLAISRERSYLRSFEARLENRDALTGIHASFSRSQALFDQALGNKHARSGTLERELARIEAALAHASRIARMLNGPVEELAQACLAGIDRSIGALLFPPALARLLSGMLNAKDTPDVINRLIISTFVEYQCAILHYNAGDAIGVVARLDPLIDAWQRTGLARITSSLNLHSFIMLNTLKAHDRASAAYERYLELVLEHGDQDAKNRALLGYLNYLGSIGSERKALDIIDKVMKGLLYKGVGDTEGIARLKADLHYRSGEYDLAADAMEQHIRSCFEAEHMDQMATVLAIGTLGLYQKRSGRFEQALASYSQALNLALERLPDDHLLASRIKSNMASLLRDNGRLKEGIKLMNEVVEVHRSEHGADHPLTATELIKRASLLVLEGEYDQSRSDLASALYTLGICHDDDKPDWDRGRALHLLGRLDHALGDPTAAKDAFDRAYREFEAVRTRGEMIKEDLAEVLTDQGRMMHDHGIEGAHKRSQEAHSMFRALLGPDHFMTCYANCWRILTEGAALGAGSEWEPSMRVVEERFQSHHSLVLELRLEHALRTGDADAMDKAVADIDALGPPVKFLAAKAHYLHGVFRTERSDRRNGHSFSNALELFKHINPGHPMALRCMGT